MGYDVTIHAYDEDGHFIGFIIDDWSLTWMREFSYFSHKHIHHKDSCGEEVFAKQTAIDFLYYCEKHGLCVEEEYRGAIEVAKRIRDCKNLAFYDIIAV
jgi:hypothetical protein